MGFFSVLITVITIVTGKYFSEIENIRSFKDKEKYMLEDFLKLESTSNSSDDTGYKIKGRLKSNGTLIFLNIISSSYIDFRLEYQPLYKSKLSGDYFLKNAHESYYKSKLRGFYSAIILKIAFYFILVFFIIEYRKYYFRLKL